MFVSKIFLLLTSRDENGDLQTSLATNRVADAVTTRLPTLSGNMEMSDRDSGVAVELASIDANSSKLMI